MPNEKFTIIRLPLTSANGWWTSRNGTVSLHGNGNICGVRYVTWPPVQRQKDINSRYYIKLFIFCLPNTKQQYVYAVLISRYFNASTDHMTDTRLLFVSPSSDRCRARANWNRGKNKRGRTFPQAKGSKDRDDQRCEHGNANILGRREKN